LTKLETVKGGTFFETVYNAIGRKRYPELRRFEVQIDEADNSKRWSCRVVELPRTFHLSFGRVPYRAMHAFKRRRNGRRQWECERIAVSTSYQLRTLATTCSQTVLHWHTTQPNWRMPLYWLTIHEPPRHIATRKLAVATYLSFRLTPPIHAISLSNLDLQKDAVGSIRVW